MMKELDIHMIQMKEKEKKLDELAFTLSATVASLTSIISSLQPTH
jgi:hypothetical protein